MSKKIVDYVDKTFLAPPATSGSGSIALFGSAIDAPVRIIRPALIYFFRLIMELRKHF